MDGYNNWREYADEIVPGTLIRLGHEYVKVTSVVAPQEGGLFIISFDREDDDLKLHLSGEIRIDGNRVIETFTKQPS